MFQQLWSRLSALLVPRSTKTRRQPSGSPVRLRLEALEERVVLDAAPFVQSLNRSSPTSELTNATQVSYVAQFSEAVTGVDATDFALVTSTLTTGAVEVTGSGATYTVTIKSIIGDGTLGLNLVDDGTIRDSAGQKLTSTTINATSFQKQQTFATGEQPNSVVMGDLNRDGKPDLVVPNGNNSTLSVLLGNGDGTFQTQQTIATSGNPRSVAIGDVNGDGKLDLAATGYTNGSVSVLLGNGDGTFQSPRSFGVGVSPVAVAMGDLNGDGKLDLAVANFSSSNLSVLLGDGNGMFSAQKQLVTAKGRPLSVALGDANGDGKLDLAFTHDSTNTSREDLRNGGLLLSSDSDIILDFSSSFRPHVISYSLAMGDVNGDGLQDLAFLDSQDNRVEVQLSKGDGTIRYSGTFPTGTQPMSVVMGDVNDDGMLDLAIANEGNNSVSVLQGEGNGNFTGQSTFNTGKNPVSVAMSDVNGDGKLDLTVANRGSNTVSVLLSSIIGNFTGQVYQVDQTPPAVTINQSNKEADPINSSSLARFTVRFSEAVTGFTSSDLDFTGSTTPGTLRGIISSFSSSEFLVQVTGMTGDGVIVVRIPANAAQDLAGNENLASTSTDNSVTYDPTPPVTTNDRVLDRSNLSTLPPTFKVTFSEPIKSFNPTRDYLEGKFSGTPVLNVTNTGLVYTVTVNGLTGQGSVRLYLFEGAVRDLANNFNTRTISTAIPYDFVAPTPTIRQDNSQLDPTTTASVKYAITFNENVTGFDPSDFDFTGSTAPGTLAATITGSGSSYTATVTGMTGQGTIVARIRPNAVKDALGNDSLASVNQDNVVTYQIPVQIDSVKLTEGNSGTKPLTFTVTLGAASSVPVLIPFQTHADAALVDKDFLKQSGTLTFEPNATTKTITVQIVGDSVKEADEIFFLKLSNPSNATLKVDTGVGTILNDEFTIGTFENGHFTFQSPDRVFDYGLKTDTPLVGDFNRDGKTDVGVYRQGKNSLFIIDSNGSGKYEPSDRFTAFGAVGIDQPVVGNWTGAGDSIGVYRNNGYFYLDLSGDGVWQEDLDGVFPYGSPGDVPIIGDWNGDGKDDIGIYRNGKFYLDANGNRRHDRDLDTSFVFRAISSNNSFVPDLIGQPIVGDWNNDGKDEVGIARHNFNIGALIYKDTSSAHVFDIDINKSIFLQGFKETGDRIFTGDWNGDGSLDFGVANGHLFFTDLDGDFALDGISKRFGSDSSTPLLMTIENRAHPSLVAWQNGIFQIDSNDSGRFDTGDSRIGLGFATDVPLVGRWFGDRDSRLGIYSDGYFILYTSFQSESTSQIHEFGTRLDMPVVGDWDGDGIDDLGIRRDNQFILDTNGNRTLDANDARFTFGEVGDTPLVADFNGDGKHDVGVWRKGVWYLDTNGNRILEPALDQVFAFGSTTAKPIVSKSYVRR